MRPRLTLKMLLRSPARTALTFILLAAVTFALFSQVMEYTIASNEIKRAVERYDGVATVEVSPLAPEATETGKPFYLYSDGKVSTENLPEYFAEKFENMGYEKLSAEQIEAISALPYVTYTDTRFMTAGYSETYRRVDDGIIFYEHTNQCVVEGTAESIHDGKITVGDLELLGGVPRRAFGDNKIIVVAEQTDATHLGLMGDRDGIPIDEVMYFNGGGDRSRITNFVTVNSKYDVDYIEENIEIGKRYVFVLRYEDYSNNLSSPLSYYLTDPFVNEYCEAVYCVDGESENYLETEKYAGLRAYIESVDRRLYTFDVVYTENMGSIRYFSDKTVGVSEGRGITREDTAQKNNVCVIHHDMAMEHGLKVGDTITLGLGDKLFEQYMSNGAVSVSPETKSENITEVALEIVGIFKDTRKDEIMFDDPAWSYSANTIFVPKHLLNADTTGHAFSPGEVSFVVDNAWDIPAFTQESAPQIENMGLTLFFTDSGWTDMLEDFRETERLSLIKIAVLVAAVLLSTCFAAFLYIVGKRREYAIMRVLGTDKKKAGGSMLLPLAVMSALAVILGSLAAYLYTLHNIHHSEMLLLISGGNVETAVPMGLFALCIIGELALILVIALIMLIIIGANSPLALIQNSTVKVKKVKKSRKNAVPEPKEPIKLGEWVSIPPLPRDGNDRSFKFISRYVLRHIRRSAGKAVLFILVSVMLLSVLGQLNIMDQAYIEIFEDVEIMSNYAGYLNFNYVSQLLESGYVTDVYYQNLAETHIEGVPVPVYLTSDMERFAGEELDVTYAEGYDESVMRSVGDVIIVGEKLMQDNGWELGDTVRLAGRGVLERVEEKFINRYIMQCKPPEGISKDELAVWKRNVIDEHREEIDAEFDKKADKFIIAGCVTSRSGNFDEVLFTPGSKCISNEYGILVILDVIEAKVKSNWKVDDYREFGEALAAKNLTGEIAFVMDDSKLDNVRNNVELMDTLYPLVMLAVLLIGGFLCGLVIVQSSKEIAIMRVLGTSVKKTRIILISEQMVLCLAGIILALAVLIFRGVSAGVYGQMAVAFVIYLAAIFAASFIAAYMTTRKNALEMLHTKE
ncbi:MAG: ABC transporter permease [Oscillospiraceae bacterium]|nr:ABC transporter permease [Oscillospiraceae bacterium]